MLERTRDKLDEARFFLGQLRKSRYGSAEFRFYYSALVSAGRSVTWVLQKELRGEHGEAFEEWWELNRDQLLPHGLEFPTLAAMRNEAVKHGMPLATLFRISGFRGPIITSMEAKFVPVDDKTRRLELTMQLDPRASSAELYLSGTPPRLTTMKNAGGLRAPSSLKRWKV